MRLTLLFLVLACLCSSQGTAIEGAPAADSQGSGSQKGPSQQEGLTNAVAQDNKIQNNVLEQDPDLSRKLKTAIVTQKITTENHNLQVIQENNPIPAVKLNDSLDNEAKSVGKTDGTVDNKSKSADSKMDIMPKSHSKLDHMPDDEPSSIDKTHGKVKNKPEDKLKSDNQPEEPKSAEELNDKPEQPKSAEEFSDKPEQPKSAVKLNDKPEQPKSAVKLNDKPEQPKSAVKLNDKPEQPKSAVELNDKPEQPKSAEELNDQTEQPKLAVKLNDQTEQPKSADKLVGKEDEKPKSEKEKDTATTDKWRAESQGTKPESEAPGRGVVEGEGNEVDDVTLEEEGDEEEDGGLNKSDKSGGQPFNPQPQEESSHFFAYLVCMALLVAVLYVGYHNKRKIIAFVLEGRRSKASRRPKTADYQKLDQH
ncbi:hypothetical protein P4O66_017421 [Electrophorus voltai]|uniref:Trans-golgi network protein 2 n=1 Tax=Electrophorus voltai TaxID=2609070 RepID=A0AAD9DPE9_9TELE|nr:hypothetical protein P4O66_017421 [Electrophorus voltai]